VKSVPGAGDEDAGATGLAPHPLVTGAWFCSAVVTGVELPVVDPELAFEQV
jgi:hypothetical protein